jgi:hypothetical protein
MQPELFARSLDTLNPRIPFASGNTFGGFVVGHFDG